ncbi:MAG: hypothetical protein QM796_10885 [Chthoniobacteraceae bacterium]
MELTPRDLKYVSAAEGYAELGMYLEADQQLESILPEHRHLPSVLAVRLSIYSGLERWDLAEVVAKSLVLAEPENSQWWISLAYATRRTSSIEAARAILMSARDHHAGEPIIHYNLACYACQLGDLESAKQFLQAAFKIAPGIRSMALEDEDLASLWDSLKTELRH